MKKILTQACQSKLILMCLERNLHVYFGGKKINLWGWRRMSKGQTTNKLFSHKTKTIKEIIYGNK